MFTSGFLSTAIRLLRSSSAAADCAACRSGHMEPFASTAWIIQAHGRHTAGDIGLFARGHTISDARRDAENSGSRCTDQACGRAAARRGLPAGAEKLDARAGARGDQSTANSVRGKEVFSTQAHPARPRRHKPWRRLRLQSGHRRPARVRPLHHPVPCLPLRRPHRRNPCAGVEQPASSDRPLQRLPVLPVASSCSNGLKTCSAPTARPQRVTKRSRSSPRT